MHQLPPYTQLKPSCVVTLDEQKIVQQQELDSTPLCLNRRITDWIPTEIWQQIVSAVQQHGDVEFEYQAKPIGHDQIQNLRTRWQLNGDRLHGLLLNTEKTSPLQNSDEPIVTIITKPNDIYTDDASRLRQNDSTTLSVLPVLHMNVPHPQATDFVDAAFAAAGDYLEREYWAIPSFGGVHEHVVIFVAKAPYAYHAEAAYKQLMYLEWQAPIAFEIWSQGASKPDSKKGLISALQRYRFQSLTDKVGTAKHSHYSKIMTSSATIEPHKWAGMATYLQDPKALDYWNHLLNTEPLVASAYIISPHDGNKILAVGAKRTLDQLNGKANAGVPAALNQPLSFFDEQIFPTRSRLITQLTHSDRYDIPVIDTREYIDRALNNRKFGFLETGVRLQTGEFLLYCKYTSERDDLFWDDYIQIQNQQNS